jgi:mRNA interferase RelE/StbE
VYRVDLASSRVEHALDNLPSPIQDRVLRAIASLAENPRPPRTRKLRGTDALYRIRIGRYRVIYWIDDEKRLVVITKIAKRDESTYRRL